MSRSLLLIIIVLAIMCGWYLCHRLFPPLREGWGTGLIGKYNGNWECTGGSTGGFNGGGQDGGAATGGDCRYIGPTLNDPTPVNGSYFPVNKGEYPKNSYFGDGNGQPWPFRPPASGTCNSATTAQQSNCIPELPIWKHENQDVYFWIGPPREDYINKERTRACGWQVKTAPNTENEYSDGKYCGYGPTSGSSQGVPSYVAYIGGPGERYKPDIYYLTGLPGSALWLGLEKGGLAGNALKAIGDDYFKLKTYYFRGNPPSYNGKSGVDWTAMGTGPLGKYADSDQYTQKPLYQGYSGCQGCVPILWAAKGLVNSYIKRGAIFSLWKISCSSAGDATKPSPVPGGYATFPTNPGGSDPGRGAECPRTRNTLSNLSTAAHDGANTQNLANVPLADREKGQVGLWQTGTPNVNRIAPDWTGVASQGFGPISAYEAAGSPGYYTINDNPFTGGCYITVQPRTDAPPSGNCCSDLTSYENAMRLQVNVVGCPAGVDPGKWTPWSPKCPPCNAAGSITQTRKCPAGESCPDDGLGTSRTISCPKCPTCDNFTCEGKTHKSRSSSACTSGTCQQSDCCVDNPTCTESVACNNERVLQTNYQNIICKGAQCTDSDCCASPPQPTCAKHACPGHSTKKANPGDCTSGICTDDECCVKPTCATDNLVCSGDYENGPTFNTTPCSSYSCTREECCQLVPKCTLDFSCPKNTHVTNPLPTNPCAASPCMDNDCCTANPQCDSPSPCTTGRQIKPGYKDHQCAGALCQDKECCEAIPQSTCQGFSCPNHYSLRDNADSIDCATTSCSDDECCSADPMPTCEDSSVSCPAGYEEAYNPSNITCASYTCQPSDCCILAPPPPPPIGPSHTDIRRATNIDNRKWVNDSRRINKHNWEDNRTQTLTQNDPRLFSSTARIDNPDKGSVFYPGSTFIVFGKGKNKKGRKKKQRNPFDILPPQPSKKCNHSHVDAWASPRQQENKRTNNMFSAFSQQEVGGGFQNPDHFDEVSASEGGGKPSAFNNDIYVKAFVK